MSDKKGINPAAAGMVGAVVGAAVGAAAVVLSDEKNRKKLGAKVDQFKKEGSKTFQDLKRRAGETQEQFNKRVEQIRGKVEAEKENLEEDPKLKKAARA